jgi:methylase of polypeptide subunit release factors
MELGQNQADAVVGMVEETRAYTELELLKDLAEIDRVIVAKKI